MTQPEIAENSVATPVRFRLWIWVKRVVLAFALTSFFTVVFVGALVVTVPATVVREFATLPPQVTGLYGSLWQGRAQLLGGNMLEWRTSPTELLFLRLRSDLTLRGPDTQVTGQLTLSPLSLRLTDISGRAGPGLLQLVPDVPIKACTTRAVLDVQELRLARGAASADGQISIDAGVCVDMLDREQSVPQMEIDFLSQGNDAVGVLNDRDGQLARLTLAGDRRVIVRVEPEGATLVPGMPTSGPIILEYPF